MTKEQELKLKLEELNSYRTQRQLGYGMIDSQLNLLYDDIKAGLFGESAKQGEWFAHITGVKAAHPKPDIALLKAEIDQLMTEVDVGLMQSQLFPGFQSGNTTTNQGS
jgi:hypothetical protein